MADDPINPAHYAGTECAQIGERLTGNSYQVLKYNWRLGKKDDAKIEVGKALWYLQREIALTWEQCFPLAVNLPSDAWFYERFKNQDLYVQSIAVNLVSWNRTDDAQCLTTIERILKDKLAELERGSQ